MKGCGKSAPRARQRGRHGKPHREQDRIGATAAGNARGPFPARRPGWLLEARGNARPRGMAATSRRQRRAIQNPAYRPSGTFHAQGGVRRSPAGEGANGLPFALFPASLSFPSRLSPSPPLSPLPLSLSPLSVIPDTTRDLGAHARPAWVPALRCAPAGMTDRGWLSGSRLPHLHRRLPLRFPALLLLASRPPPSPSHPALSPSSRARPGI